MLTKILVLCAGLVISVVSANPLLQALVSQSCPICEQNSLKNQIQNLLLQSIQPYPQVYFDPSPAIQPLFPVEQPYSLCPTQNKQNQNLQPIQNRQTQNSQPSQNRQNQNYQPPCQQILNQPYCPRSQPAQAQDNNAVPNVVNKLLSNPNIRSIMDPNTKMFNQNGVEVSRNGPCGTGTPNVVNNYIILPPDFLLDDIINNPRCDQKLPAAERKVKQINNNSNKRTEVVTNGTGMIESPSDNGKRKQRRRQRNKTPDIKVKVVQENSTQAANQIESPQPMERKNEEVPSGSIKNATTTPTQSTKNSKEAEIRNSQSKLNENVSSTSENIKPIRSQGQTSPAEKLNSQGGEPQVKQIKETTTVKPHSNRNIAKTKTKKSKARHFNAREEAVIKDFRQKFPNIPEDVVINLIAHMKKQLQQQNYNVPSFYYPQFPISYDQLFRNPFSQTPTIVVSSQGKKSKPGPQKPATEDENLINNGANRIAKRRKNRRNKNQQTVKKSTTPEILTNTESTPVTVLAKSDKSHIETTTKEILLPDKIATEIEVAAVTKQNDNIETTTSKLIENLKKLEDVETDAKVLIKDNNVVPINELGDEYYPDFTSDHQYYSNEDFSFIILEDDRFHYTTDKNLELGELNRERRRHDSSFRKNAMRPEGRYILRLKNKDKSRTILRQNEQDKNSQTKTSESTLQSGIKTEIPKIVVKVKPKENLKPEADEESDFVAWNFQKPPTLADEKEEQFRTPPTLEKIDFETKQINKKHNSYDDFETKTSSYSDFKTPQYNFNKYDDKYKHVDFNNNAKLQIETANSKVATYGKPSSVEVSTEKDIWMDIDKEYSRIENDGRKVVFAKSIDGDFW